MNDELKKTRDSRLKTQDGFTLVELVIAIAILAMVIFFSGVIFKSGIGSYRAASAQAEIMQKLRAITEQLDLDFKGLRKDAPMFIWFQQLPTDSNQRFDQIMFFADGDFQSIRPYDADINSPHLQIPNVTGTPVVSNVARIQYGHARVYSPSQAGYVNPENQQNKNPYGDRFLNIDHRTLARRQHLLTADPNIYYWPDSTSPTNFQLSFIPQYNSYFEHDVLSLSQWQALTYNTSNNNTVITTCFDSTYSRPSLNFGTGDGLYMLMTEGVGSFSIQWSYYYQAEFRYLWWPSIDPDGNGNISDSDFARMGLNSFGICFNCPGGESFFNWSGPDGALNQYVTNFSSQYPAALKFTFTLYDSKGVFEDGQTFTHIVYLGD